MIAIDVGIVNLALIKAKVDDTLWTIHEIMFAQVIDLTSLRHDRVPSQECKLHHSNDIYDRIQHFLQEYQYVFEDESIETILIERQPLGGLCHVEQLLFGHFREKAKLISPNAMHRFFHINHLSYEARKEQTTKITKAWLEPFWQNRERVHDLADALCIMLYYLHTQHTEQKQKQKHDRFQEHNNMLHQKLTETPQSSVEHFFEQFRYSSKTVVHDQPTFDKQAKRTRSVASFLG